MLPSQERCGSCYSAIWDACLACVCVRVRACPAQVSQPYMPLARDKPYMFKKGERVELYGIAWRCPELNQKSLLKGGRANTAQVGQLFFVCGCVDYQAFFDRRFERGGCTKWEASCSHACQQQARGVLAGGLDTNKVPLAILNTH